MNVSPKERFGTCDECHHSDEQSDDYVELQASPSSAPWPAVPWPTSAALPTAPPRSKPEAFNDRRDIETSSTAILLAVCTITDT